jgi:hypothetical protein
MSRTSANPISRFAMPRSAYFSAPIFVVIFGVLLELAGIVPAGSQEPQTYTDAQGRSAIFPQGALSFADQVADYRVGDPAPTVASALETFRATGVPDGTSLSLGCNGSVVVGFVDNVLINVDGPDLYVFEIGPDVESTLVEISADGAVWVLIGPVEGSTASVDIQPQSSSASSFRFVRLTDRASACGSGGYSGADIDAVGAIGSVSRDPVPTAVRFVQEDAFGFAPLDALSYADSFHVEVDFDTAPVEAEHIATLEWNGGASEVTVFRTAEDSKLFRSQPIKLRPPGGGTDVEP